MNSYGNNQKKLICYIIFAIILLVLVVNYFMHRGVRRGVKDIPEPVQTEAEGMTTVDINGYHLYILFKYEYDIKALVVSEKSYSGLGIDDRLAPKDVALAWGKVAEYNDRIDFNWRQSGRWYMWSASSYDEIAPVGGESGINTSSSNNHLIPANNVIKREIKKIKRGDYVEIKGYLVDINGSNSGDGSFYWDSSKSREDTGDGSCEVIYVTDIEWLD